MHTKLIYVHTHTKKEVGYILFFVIVVRCKAASVWHEDDADRTLGELSNATVEQLKLNMSVGTKMGHYFS